MSNFQNHNFYDVDVALQKARKEFHSHSLYYEYMKMLLNFPLVIKYVFSLKDTEKFLEVRELHRYVLFLAEAKKKLQHNSQISFYNHQVRG